MLWGAAIAAGARAYQKFGKNLKAQTLAILASKKLVDAFVENKGTANCLEITEIDKSSTNWDMIFYFLIKGGSIGCVRLANKFAPQAYKAINDTFSEEITGIPESLPVSCASILAEKMGLTDEQKMMVSGFAGGIGLCGGACGALGAAVWINAMKSSEENEGKVEFKDPRGLAVVEEFVKISDYKFECKDIVGRKFESVQDHADYIQNGGCSEILEILAGEFKA